jgi:flagellar biosynthesis/type III secretory pathway chaperone
MPTSLLSLLQQQFKQLVQMNEFLLCERDAFATRQPELIESATQQKTVGLQQLQDIDKQISSQYNAADFEHESITPIKIEIDNALAQLKQQNVVNGKIIASNQISLGMLKDILIGNKKDRSAMTYDQTGKKSNTLKSRPIKA